MLFLHPLRLFFARYALLSCALLACAAITACGGGGGTTNSNTTATPTNTGTTETVAPVTVITTPPVTPSSTVSVPDGTKTVSTVTSAACANPQTTVPPTISAVTSVSFVSSGADQNQTSDSIFTQDGLLSAVGLGTGPYYANSALTKSEIDGLGIQIKVKITKDITFYHQLDNGELRLVGFQAYLPLSIFGARSLLSTTKYSTALPYGLMKKDSPASPHLFTMTAGQAVTQSFTATTTFVDPSMTSTVTINTQRIEFIGMDSINPGGTQAYTACKFTNTEATAQGSQVTTLWYLQGKGILLKSRTDITSSAGVTETTNDTALVKAVQNGAVVFPYLK
jgi:hypothetical protein